MTDFAKLQKDICKAASAAEEIVKLAPKETLPYELSKCITLEELADRAYEEAESQCAREVSKLQFQISVNQKFDFANRMIESISEDISKTGKYDNRLPVCMGIRDACEIVSTIINKTLGHWEEPACIKGKECHDQNTEKRICPSQNI